MISLLRRAVLTIDLDDTQVTPIATGACPAMALAALGSVLGQIGGSIRRDRALLRQWLAREEGIQA